MVYTNVCTYNINIIKSYFIKNNYNISVINKYFLKKYK